MSDGDGIDNSTRVPPARRACAYVVMSYLVWH
jgi:hypothetical protein